MIDREGFLRSINIAFDAGSPQRIAHFFPTEKSVALIDRLLERQDADSCYMVAAPYGSGKSLAGAVALHFIENRGSSKVVLRQIGRRIHSVSPGLSETLDVRIRDADRRGLGIPLHGHCDNLASALVAAAIDAFERLGLLQCAKLLRAYVSENSGADQIADTLGRIKQVAEHAKIDRILVLWDEFGRHLETLVAEGRTAELSDLQLLAEFSSRQKAVPVSLALFLHQGFFHYANGLPQSVRREWKKIEGRFVTVDYVEDSKEIYRLISDLVHQRSLSKRRPPKAIFKAKAQELVNAGRFSGLAEDDLAVLLERAYPLTPAAVELLPRISARVSQNERTLFSFLFQLQPMVGELNADVLFDYFGEQMQADVEVGGTYRQWLETESALHKVSGDALASKALKITCLLGLGLSGERARPGREAVSLALAGYGERAVATEILGELIARKLLLHRRHSDEIAVWHGTDLDLRGRLAEEKADLEVGFDLVAFLSREASSPVWKPQEYNDEFGIRRHFNSYYLTLSQLEEYLAHSRNPLTVCGPEEDGKIYYLLPTNGEQVKEAKRLLEGYFNGELIGDQNLRVVFVIPSEPLPIESAALEVACLLSMAGDPELTEADPLVLPEIQQMLDDARAHLQRLIERLTIPNGLGLAWIYGKDAYGIPSTRLLRRFLSNIMRKVYRNTPKIHNEMIVRRRPSSPVVNSRKKLLMGILERGGQEHFGIEGNFPDASMCRTVLEDTGLYRLLSTGERWGYASAADLADPGLSKVWLVIQDFFATPSSESKRPSDLFGTLMAPPYGVRPGLLPILFAAGLKAFAYTTSLLRDGEFIADVLPSDVELLCKEPDRHLLKVLYLTSEDIGYLERVRKLFSGQRTTSAEQDLVRNTHEALQGWLHQLPAASLSTKRLSEHAAKFRDALRVHSDPVELLLRAIPKAIGQSKRELTTRRRSALVEVKEEIESILDRYRDEVELSIRRALQTSNEDGSCRVAAKRWASTFVDVLPAGHPARPVLVRMTMEYDNDSKLIDSVAAALGRVSIARWDDQDVSSFARAIEEAVQAVETAVLRSDLSRFRGKGSAESVKRLLTDRIQSYAAKLRELLGESEAADLLAETLNSNVKL